MTYPVLTLSDASLSFDSKPLFKNVNLSVQKGDRICLVGRNGSGKSSLLKIMAGTLCSDSGTRFVKPGSSISFLKQSYDFNSYSTLEEFVFEGLEKKDYLKYEDSFSGIAINFNTNPVNASGGELRRAALLRTFLTPSDILLLDEPTNHLDIDAIEFLEQYLLLTRRAFILISHDRLFLENLGEKILWIDRGKAQKMNKSFSHFEDWREKSYTEELMKVQKLTSKIKKESVWAVEGISARRKRNQRRLQELSLMKEQKAATKALPVNPKFKMSLGEKSAKLVVEAKNIIKTFGENQIIQDFTFSIQRGDRIAVVGPNGIGKTTLINLLLKKVQPDFGTVKLGMALSIAVFDQNKEALPTDVSLWNFLSGITELGGSGKNDQIMVHGKPRHIVGYLNDFLFTREQTYGLISDLSGGEKSRLLLAVLMAKDSNMLVLDEPTNDLDLETLDLLKELISSYEGTVLFVSHDRDFIDSVATHTFLMEENKPIIVHSGGFSDFRQTHPKSYREKESNFKHQNSKLDVKVPAVNFSSPKNLDRKISDLEKKIESLNYEISQLELFLSNKDLYVKDKQKFERATHELISRQTSLQKAEEMWLKYESLRE